MRGEQPVPARLLPVGRASQERSGGACRYDGTDDCAAAAAALDQREEAHPLRRGINELLQGDGLRLWNQREGGVGALHEDPREYRIGVALLNPVKVLLQDVDVPRCRYRRRKGVRSGRGRRRVSPSMLLTIMEPSVAWDQHGWIEDSTARSVDVIEHCLQVVPRTLKPVKLILQEWGNVFMMHETSLRLVEVVNVLADDRDRPPRRNQ